MAKRKSPDLFDNLDAGEPSEGTGRGGPPAGGGPGTTSEVALHEAAPAVRADDLPHLHSFANGLERDHAAVLAGLTLPYSSGPVEGKVCKIKFLKRLMFGRASYDLLRKMALLN